MLNFVESFFPKRNFYDLLDYKEKVEELIDFLKFTDLIVVFGYKGEGKTTFLKILSKKLKDYQFLTFSQLISKRTKKSDFLIIDDFHLISLLDNEKVIEIVETLKSKKVVISFNPVYLERLEKENKLKKEIIKDFLESAFYSVNLREIMKEKEEKLIDYFFATLENEFKVKTEEEGKEILKFIIENRKLSFLTLKKLFLHLYLKIKKDYLNNKLEKIDIKKYLPSYLISSYYWYKELNSTKEKIDLSSIYNRKIKEIEKKEEKKEEEIMDINEIMDKYLENNNDNNLLEKIKNNPSLIEDNIFIYDYKDEIMYKGVLIKDLIKNVEKPSLIGYKDDKLYLIYIVENIEEINVRLLEELNKLKSNNQDLEIVIVTKKKDKNKDFINKYGLNEFLKIVEV